MILKLIRLARSHNAYTCTLVECDPFNGEQTLAEISESMKQPCTELFYPLSVTRSGICLAGKQTTNWNWKRKQDKENVGKYLLSILRSGEEIRLEVTHKQPDYPGYPYVCYNAYARCGQACTLIKAEKEKNNGDD